MSLDRFIKRAAWEGMRKRREEEAAQQAALLEKQKTDATRYNAQEQAELQRQRQPQPAQAVLPSPAENDESHLLPPPDLDDADVPLGHNPNHDAMLDYIKRNVGKVTGRRVEEQPPAEWLNKTNLPYFTDLFRRHQLGEFSDTPEAEAMKQYITTNSKPGVEPAPYPTEWMDETNRQAFGRLSEEILGEDQSDRFLNSVFSSLSQGANFDPNDKFRSKKNDIYENFSPQAKSFLDQNKDFVATSTTKIMNDPNINSDADAISSGIYRGIAYSLAEPAKGNMDQRLNFFILNPEKLTDRAIQALSSIQVISEPEQYVTPEDKKAGYRSIWEARSRDINNPLTGVKDQKRGDPEFKRKVLAALGSVAQDSAPGAGDGLLTQLEQLIQSKDPSLQNFVYSNMRYQVDSVRAENAKRSRTEGYGGFGPADDEGVGPAPVSLEEGGRRADERQEDDYSKAGRADYLKEISQQSLGDVKNVSDSIIKSLRGAALKSMSDAHSFPEGSEKQRIAYQKADKDMFRAEQLDAVLSLSLKHISNLLNPANEMASQKATDARGYRLHNSKITSKKGGQVDFSKLVPGDLLSQQIREIAELKKKIVDARDRGLNIEQIAQETGQSPEFVDGTLSQDNFYKILQNKGVLNSKVKVMRQPGESQEDFEARRAQHQQRKGLYDTMIDMAASSNIRTNMTSYWTQLLPMMKGLQKTVPPESMQNLVSLVGVHKSIAEPQNAGGYKLGYMTPQEKGKEDAAQSGQPQPAQPQPAQPQPGQPQPAQPQSAQPLGDNPPMPADVFRETYVEMYHDLIGKPFPVKLSKLYSLSKTDPAAFQQAISSFRDPEQLQVAEGYLKFKAAFKRQGSAESMLVLGTFRKANMVLSLRRIASKIETINGSPLTVNNFISSIEAEVPHGRDNG